jgi:hypothetical protein
VSDAGDPPHGARGRQGDEEQGEHAEEHDEQVSQPELPAVLLLGAGEVARRRKLHPQADASAQQVDEERDGGRPGEGEPEGSEEGHGE